MVKVAIVDVVTIETKTLPICVVSTPLSIVGRMEHVHMIVLSVNNQQKVTNQKLHLTIRWLAVLCAVDIATDEVGGKS